MFKFRFVRSTVLIVVLILGICFAAQSFGKIHPGTSTSVTTSESQVNVASPPRIEWSVAGMLATGILIVLLCPRHRAVVSEENEK